MDGPYASFYSGISHCRSIYSDSRLLPLFDIGYSTKIPFLDLSFRPLFFDGVSVPEKSISMLGMAAACHYFLATI